MNSHVQELNRRLAERKAWELANPELAAAWTDAMAEDHERAKQRERAQLAVDVRRAAPAELARCGFPAMALDALRAVDVKQQHIVMAREYLADPSVLWLALLGSPGQGKTVAAAYVARELLARRGINNQATGSESQFCAFVRATTFARLSAYQADDKVYFESLCNVRLLVLDDLGTETLAGMSQAHFEELLDVRYAEKRRTVLTSNLEPEAFMSRYRGRIADRLKQCGLISAGKGPSLRKRAGGAA